MARPPLPSGVQMWKKTEPLKKFIFWCLENRPGTRGSDRLLEYYVWRYYDHINIQNGMTIAKMLRLTSSESIRRRRQEIQNAKNENDEWIHPKLRPSNRTDIKRAVRGDAIHNYYSGGYQLPDFLEIGVVPE